MQDAPDTSTAIKVVSACGQRIVASVYKEIRTRRFVLSCIVAAIWLALLLILSAREGHGLFESIHTQTYEPFQLPSLETVERPQPIVRAGTLKRQAGFGGFSANYDQRDWFELQLPAAGSEALAPEAVVALENLRLFNPSGTLLCSLDMRLDAARRPSTLGVGADLDLSQQPVEYPVREISGHRFEVFWASRYSPSCPYKEPAWAVADVILKRAVADKEELWLELADGERVIRAGNSSITSRPGALPGEWWIEVLNLDEQSLHFVPGDYPAHQAWHRVRWPHTWGYESLWELLVRNEASLAADTYQIRFEGSPPAGLPVRLLRGKEERLADVRFSTDVELRSNPAIAPTWHIPLAHSELDIPLALPTQAQGQEYHELFLPITLSAVCQLRVVDSDLPSLRWRAVARLPMEKYRRYAQLPEDDLDRVRWELQSADGVQRFFHDIRVASELLCPARMAWQALPYQAGEMPWLVAADVLPAGVVQPEQPARELFGRFRFLDASGQALMPIARSSDLADPHVEAFLFPGEVFKFHGEVVRVEQLVTVDAAPRSVSWVYAFMTLEAN